MGQIMKDKSRVCQIPPTLIEASGKWYQKPWTAIMSLSIQTKAASFQLIIAALLLLIGGVSFYVTNFMNSILFDEYGIFWIFSHSDTRLSTLFLVTIMPLLIGVIALILVYGFWMDNKISWRMAISVNIAGLLTVLPSAQVLSEVFNIYSDGPLGSEYYYQLIMSNSNIWSILFWLIPLSIILSFTMIIYLGFAPGPRSMISVQDSGSNELQQSKGIGR
ncbi:MAG: hypothetical protein ACFFE6_09320 [Candidatus Thorarchaeota archaeon]